MVLINPAGLMLIASLMGPSAAGIGSFPLRNSLQNLTNSLAAFSAFHNFSIVSLDFPPKTSMFSLFSNRLRTFLEKSSKLPLT